MDIPTTLSPGTEPELVDRVHALRIALGADTPEPVAEPASPGGTAAAAGLVDELRALEELVCAAQARQAALAAALPESRATGSQVGLARRVSPVKGRIQLGLARILVAGELPYTWAAFRAGAISEWRVTIIARETACLTLEDRLRVDAEVAGDQDRLSSMGDAALVAACSEWAQRLDPAAVVARRRKAETQRHVGLRPAPDQMTWLSALLPVGDGVASYARLQAAAERARLAGDDRTRGQVMADTLVEAITDKADTARADAHRAATTWEPTTTTTAGGATGAEAAETGAEATEGDAKGTGTGPADATASPADAEDRSPDTTEAQADTAGAAGEPNTTADPEPEDEREAERMEGSVPSVVRFAGELTDSQPEVAGQSDRSRSDVCLNVIMTDRTLFGTADDPAWAEGYGPIDADLARELAKHDRVWLRRLFADPDTGQLVGMDAKTRRFPNGLKTLIRLRDRTCRTPWCDAPVRHIDHITPAAKGGDTSFENGQGLCEACNQAKETTGWTAQPLPGQRGHQIVTPTGHRYPSRPPAPPGYQRSRPHLCNGEFRIELAWTG